MDKPINDRNRKKGDWFAAIERGMARAIVILAALLLLSQLALHVPAARHFVTPTERWEGVRYPAE